MTALSALTLTWPLGTPALRNAMLSTFWASVTSSGGSLRPPVLGTACTALYATPSATPSRYFARRTASREPRRSAARVRSRAMCLRRAPCWRSKKKYSASAPTPPATSSAPAPRSLPAARTRGRLVMRFAIKMPSSCWSLGSPSRRTLTSPRSPKLLLWSRGCALPDEPHPLVLCGSLSLLSLELAEHPLEQRGAVGHDPVRPPIEQAALVVGVVHRPHVHREVVRVGVRDEVGRDDGQPVERLGHLERHVLRVRGARSRALRARPECRHLGGAGRRVHLGRERLEELHLRVVERRDDHVVAAPVPGEERGHGRFEPAAHRGRRLQLDVEPRAREGGEHLVEGRDHEVVRLEALRRRALAGGHVAPGEVARGPARGV